MAYWRTPKSEVEFYLVHARRPLPKNKVSRFRGVQKNSNSKKPFRVSISFNGRRFFGGAFYDEIEAAKAYNALALKVIGPNAILNEIPDRQTNKESSGCCYVGSMHIETGNGT